MKYRAKLHRKCPGPGCVLRDVTMGSFTDRAARICPNVSNPVWTSIQKASGLATANDPDSEANIQKDSPAL